MRYFDIPPSVFSLPLDVKEVTIGRASGNSIIIADQHISSVHVRMRRLSDNRIRIFVSGRNGIIAKGQIVNPGSSVDIEIDEMIIVHEVGIIITTYHLMLFADKEKIRAKFTEIDYISLSAKSIENTPKTTFLPSVRVNTGLNLDPFEIDGPPQRKTPDKQPIVLVAGPALTIAVPILLGAGRKIMVIAGVIAAMWATANVLFRRRRMKLEELKRRRIYSEYIDQCDKDINERYRIIRNSYLTSYPLISEYMTGNGNSHLLWNRNEGTEDEFRIRIGTGNIAFPVDINIPKDRFAVTEDSLLLLPKRLKEKYANINNVPITIEVNNGQKYAVLTDLVNDAFEIENSVILQLAVSYSGDELKLVYISDDLANYRWTGYLANCWIGNIPLIAQVNEYPRIYDALSHYEGNVIVFTDNRDVYDAFAGLGYVLIYRVLHYDDIPPDTKGIIEISHNFSGILYSGIADESRIEVNIDRISQNSAILYAKQISSISSHIGNSNRNIPERVLFDDVIDSGKISPEDIIDLWNNANAAVSLAAPIGIEAGIVIRTLDLDEKMDGPHGLIAGTTGSGKSELLQTIILSLALHYPPWQVNFFLIDYKGGGMANAFLDLPHVCGSISNLSGSIIERAMISIRSEIEYRQRLFALEGVNSIADYMTSNAKTKLPHIVIIVDEFAELKREEPDFLFQLVSVAQIGRSLGVHLILATQKPAGCVDDKIWSNSRFRICLKVRDKMDSMDMLHRPDASYITNTGRAFLQVGNDEVFTEFQSAYSSAPMNINGKTQDIYVYDEDYKRIKINRIVEDNTEPAKNLNEILKWSIKNSFLLSGEEPIRKLWCDEIPAVIYSEETTENGQILVGLYDDPYGQKYGKCLYMPTFCKNTAIIGLQGSGKSYMLMRILYSLIISSESVNFALYILDFGGKLLEKFSDSKMCGGYITASEFERIPKLFRYINNVIKDRLEQGKSEYKNLLIIIDNYGSLAEYMSNDIELMEMMRVSASVGVYFLITANNIGQGELPGRIFNQCDTVITLSMKDKYSYAGAFSAASSQIPIIDPAPGRGLWLVDKKIMQFQAFMPFEDDVGNDYENKIANVIKNVNIGISEQIEHFPYVPSKPILSELSTFYNSYYKDRNISNLSSIPIAYIAESGELFYLPISDAGLILISGRVRSGRKNTLCVIEYMAANQNIKSFRINSIDTLIDIYEESEAEEPFLILIEDLGLVINDFYNNTYAPDVEKKVIEFINGLNSGEIRAVNLIGIVSVKDKMLCAGRKIWNAICERPYGICLGGSVDEQTMFDFSYMNYSLASKRHPPGYASVAIYDDLFYGDIVIPRCDV